MGIIPMGGGAESMGRCLWTGRIGQNGRFAARLAPSTETIMGIFVFADSTLAMVSRARCTKQCLKFRDPRATNQAASAMADFAPFEIRTSSTFILGGETWRRLNGTRSCLIPYASLKPSSRCLTTHSKSHLQRNFGSRCAMNILTANRASLSNSWTLLLFRNDNIGRPFRLMANRVFHRRMLL